MIAVYLRVSTNQQKLASQVPDVQRWLDGHGYGKNDVIWFEDKETGKHLDRPQFAKLQAAIFNGEIDTVVCWRLDRLSRSMRDGVNTIGDWCDKGIRIISVTQQLDLSDTMGKMIAAVLFGVAECDLDTMRERQAAGIKVAKQNGVYTGRKPGTINEEKLVRAADLWNKWNTKADISRTLQLSSPTVRKYLSLANEQGIISRTL